MQDKPEFDAAAAPANYDNYIGEVAVRFPEVEFLGRRTMAGGGEAVEQIKQSEAQGILCIKMGPSIAARASKPIIIISYHSDGRVNYPLLFDRASQPKPTFDAVMRVAKESQTALQDITPLQDAKRVLINPHKGW